MAVETSGRRRPEAVGGRSTSGRRWPEAVGRRLVSGNARRWPEAVGGRSTSGRRWPKAVGGRSAFCLSLLVSAPFLAGLVGAENLPLSFFFLVVAS